MPIEPRSILESYFDTGEIPTADQFKDLIESYVHLADDGVSVYQQPGGKEKYFGIGIENPQSRLGVQAIDSDDETFMAIYGKNSSTADWYLALNTIKDDKSGFSIEEATPQGPLSRFFIKRNTGEIGLGTVNPLRELDIESSSPSDLTGIHIVNLANVKNNGWFIGETAGNGDGQDGAFSIYENLIAGNTEYFKIIPGGNVGIGVPNPDTKFHVLRDLSDPDTDLDLRLGTGIVVIGSDTNNVVFDYRGLQARTATFAPDGSTLDVSADTLNVQRMGGDTLWHGDMSIQEINQAILTDDARLGLGIVRPVEKLDVKGAIRLADALAANDGTIRFNGDFQGYMNGAWVSLTAGGNGGNGPWKINPDGTIYYLSGTGSRAGIGKDTPQATLHVLDTEEDVDSNVAAFIHNNSTTTGTGVDDNRYGLVIRNTGPFASATQSKDLGLYVSIVEGKQNSHQNIAAVFNGNILTGDLISGQQVFGLGSKYVHALQSGVAPGNAPTPGTIQIFSNDTAAGTSVFSVMTGNGDIIHLYKESALTAADNTVISDVEYGPEVAGVINNLRTRLNELEQRLKNLNHIA
jgi:hypothetical protein